MSIATQVKRLQDVRNQIRAKMVALGLSKNTDLLQKLANDLDGVDKISPTKELTDPGTSYTNVDTLSRNIDTRYIKIPKGYNDANRKFTVDGVANGSVAKATINDPGTGYVNQTTVTPSPDKQYVKVTAGYLPNSKITVEAIPSPYFDTSGVTAAASDVLSDKKFVNSSGTTVTGTIATASSNDVSGTVKGGDFPEITLSTANTGEYVSTTATAKVTIAKGLYTGSSNMEVDLSPATIAATAKATLASTASITSTDKIPSPLPAGTAQIFPDADNAVRFYSDSKNNGFITGVYLSSMPSSSVYDPTSTEPGEGYTNKKTITPAKTPKYAIITAGHLPNSYITVAGVPQQKFTIAQSAWSDLGSNANETGSYTCTITGITGITIYSDVVVVPNDTSLVASCGVYASGQETESITFKAFKKPYADTAYTVYILNN